MQQIGIVPFLVLLVISLAGSLLASLLYVQFYSSRATGSQVYRAFPLLGLSITAIFVCIQFSLPLSLGLLGALSIVRFRTPIKEPEEIGFIMLVIAASIATATFKLAFVGLLFAFALVALLVQTGGRAWARYRRDGTLVVTLPGSSAGHEPERHYRRDPAPRHHVPGSRASRVRTRRWSCRTSFTISAPRGSTGCRRSCRPRQTA